MPNIRTTSLLSVVNAHGHVASRCAIQAGSRRLSRTATTNTSVLALGQQDNGPKPDRQKGAGTGETGRVSGLKEVDSQKRATALVAAQSILAAIIRRGSLGGFVDGLKDLPSEYRPIAIRHVLNGWRQWHMDPRAKQLKTIRSMKDAELRHRAWQMIKVGERYQDQSTRGTSRTDGEQ